MSVSARLSSCSSDYLPGGAALLADKAQQPAIDLAVAYPDRHDAVVHLMDLRPAGIFRRQVAAWRGLCGEFTRTIRRETFEVRYDGAWPLLIAYESAQRFDGETVIGGLPRSTLRDLSRRLVFVPAGLGFREWQEPRSLTSTIYLHIDPHNALIGDEKRLWSLESTPRLFFESAAQWQTALKLKRLVETGPTASPLHVEALAAVLLHELLDSRSASTCHRVIEFVCRRRKNIKKTAETGKTAAALPSMKLTRRATRSVRAADRRFNNGGRREAFTPTKRSVCSFGDGVVSYN
jgi:hypothetical protein